MINLIKTKTIDSKYILQKLYDNYNNPQRGKKRSLFIVPDRIVLSYEMLILDKLNIEGTVDIDVASFRTLADKVLGKSAKRSLNQQTETMLVRKIIEEKCGEFKYFKTAAAYVGFANEVLSLLALIRGNGIDVDSIRRLIPAMPDKYRNKTSDILLIYDEYIKLLSNDYSDYISKLEALRDNFPDYYDDIYISEFTSFSKIELDIIGELIKKAQNVYITLPYTKASQANSYIFPSKAIENIKALAKDFGIACNEEIFEDELAPQFKTLYEDLFSFKKFERSSVQDSTIKVKVAKNPEDEVKSLAIQIKELVNNGCRYKDIACVCCDVENYKATFESLLKKYDIPYYIDAKEQLVNQNLTKILLNGIKVRQNGYLQIDVFALLKELSYIFDIQQINEFENYCLKHGVEFEGKFKNELAYEEDPALLDRVNKIRKKLVYILSPLDFKECITVKDCVDRIRAFFEAINAQDLCDRLAKDQEKAGLSVESSVTNQVYRKILAILDQFDLMLGDCKMSHKKFIKILESTIASVTITTIPMYIDCVYIGDLEKSRYERKKYLFVVGANEGLFPREIQERGLLTNQEFEEWNRTFSTMGLGIQIYPSIIDANQEAKLNVLMVLLKPLQNLVISYPLVDMQSNKLEMASVLEDICAIAGQDAPYADDVPTKDWTVKDYARYIGSRKNALEGYISLDQKIKNNELEMNDILAGVMAELKNMAREDLQNDEKLEQIIKGERDIDADIDYKALDFGHVSISMFQKFFACPFKYCIDYILHLKERDIAGVKVQDTGTILHKCLEVFFKQDNYETYNIDQIRELVEKVVFNETDKQEYAYLREPEFKYTLNHLIDNAVNSIDILLKKMQTSLFKPYKLEAKFSNDRDSDYGAIKIKLGDKEVEFKGVIDRIDKYNNEFMVIDYKSKSSIDFKLSEIVYGKTIQALLYLKKVMDEEKAIPAGSFYLPLSGNVTSVSKEEKMKYVGLINDDVNILKDMDTTYDPQDTKFNGMLYPFKYKSSKEPISATSGSVMISSKEFNELSEYVIKLLTKAAKEMDSGFIKISPLSLGEASKDIPSPCEYCSYKAMCNIESNPQKIRQIYLKNNDKNNVIQIIRKEADDGRED